MAEGSDDPERRAEPPADPDAVDGSVEDPVEDPGSDAPVAGRADRPETVGTGSYVAISCVAAMGGLLVILIVGLLISRWLG